MGAGHRGWAVAVLLLLAACSTARDSDKASQGASAHPASSDISTPAADGPTSPAKWTVARKGVLGGRAWRLFRGMAGGNECFKFGTAPQLPVPAPGICDTTASLYGDSGASPMVLQIAKAADGTGYIYGGVAPELRTATIHYRDGTEAQVPVADRTLVAYSARTGEIEKITFVAAGASGKCVTGTEAATFNCSWAEPSR